MSTAEIVARSSQVAAMERDMADARRTLTLAEVDLIFAARGYAERMAEAKRRFKAAAEILNKWSQEEEK